MTLPLNSQVFLYSGVAELIDHAVEGSLLLLLHHGFDHLQRLLAALRQEADEDSHG